MSKAVSDILHSGLLSEIKRLEFRARRAVDADILGSYKSAFRGSGLVFSDVREYQPGDDIRSIHWKVTARTGKVYVKDFEEDRQLTFLVAVDISRSTIFGTSRANQTRMAEFAALLFLLARQNNDKIGLCLFDDSVQTYLPPSQPGRNHFQRLLYTLLQPRTANPATDISVAMKHVLSHQRRRSVVFFLSDFYSPPFEEALRRLAIRHEVICAHCSDPAETAPPRCGLIQIVDSETGQIRTIDTSSQIARKDFTLLQRQRTIRLQNLCKVTGSDYVSIADNPMRSLSELMRTRTARLQ
jgi:uncharacterized protein (DUF58 family)